MSRYRIIIGGDTHTAEVAAKGKHLHCTIGDHQFTLEILDVSSHCYTVRSDTGDILNCQISSQDKTTFITSDAWCWTGAVSEFYGQSDTGDSDHGHGDIKAPMPGRIVALPVAAGNTVKKGDAVVVIEAMKMQNALSTPIEGTIQTIHVKIGDAVESGQTLVTIA